ncbi:MAG: alkaline phosphatase family protein, partial [Actinomycetota bacterium]|nr:alkaline phosphatase family protein [Actinomycetota bacterium]
VKALLESLDGVEQVLDEDGKHRCGLDHARAGELVAVSKADRWFSYYYWLDDQRAPDYARTVDIHRKPGYDPAELFIDPALRAPMLRVGAWMLQSKLLNQRVLLDVIPIDASIVRGSHGRPTDRPEDGPLLITNTPELLGVSKLDSSAVKQLVLAHLFDR